MDWVRADDLVIVRLVVDVAGVLLNESVAVGDGCDECVRLSDCVSVVPTVVMGVSDNVAVVETVVENAQIKNFWYLKWSQIKSFIYLKNPRKF